MERAEVVVIGAGISGLAFAHRALAAGRSVTVIEASERVGGCLHSPKDADGRWFELGAHTTYNSYGGLLEMAEAAGMMSALLERGPARKTFGLLRGGEVRWLTPPKVLLQLNWLELLLSAPLGYFRSKQGQSMAGYYGGLIGRGNFAKVLSAFLAAVPSQSADDFPAEGPGSLFKKRPRREDVVRSFGFEGGLQAVCEAVAAREGLSLRTGVAVTQVLPGPEGTTLRLADGSELVAERVALATPVQVTARLLGQALPALAQALGEIETVEVDSMGLRLPESWMPPCAFVVPVRDSFFSAVTRDPFPDGARRSFAFHFRPGQPREVRLARMAEVLQIPVAQLGSPIEAQRTLPAPRVGHDQRVAAIDAALASSGLALCGNYFDGLAIEDCVQRGFSEWDRVGAA